jgi:hypothetical protein
LENKVLTKIVLLPVTHPFRARLLALIIGVFVMQAAVQATVKVTAAMRANLLPAHPALKFDLFPAGMTDPHVIIIPGKEGECKGV